MELLALTRGYVRAVVNSKSWPKAVKARFIEPGLARYDDPNGINGTILIQKPALDKMASSFVGKPVIDQQHADAKPENFQEIADGVVFRVWYDAADGWYWCEFLVWDEATLRHCADPGYSVSCAYEPTEVNQTAGKHNNVDYDAEFLNGEYTHIAIVKDPRYEQAKIVMNSKGERMNLFKIFNKKTVENTMDGASAYCMVNGSKVMLHEMVEGYKKDKQDEADQKNALQDDAEIDIDGEKVPVKNLLSSHLKRMAMAKNADDKKEEEKEDKKAENADDKKEDKKEEKEEKAENGIEGEAQKKSGEEMSGKEGDAHADPDNDEKKTATNALGEKAGKHIEEFKETMEMRNAQPMVPTVMGMTERLQMGAKRYGSKKGA